MIQPLTLHDPDKHAYTQQQYTHIHSPFSHILINKVSCIYHPPSSRLLVPICQLISSLSPTADTPNTMPLFRRRQRNQVYQQQRPIQNRNYCCEGHMIIGFILSLVAALLLYVPTSKRQLGPSPGPSCSHTGPSQLASEVRTKELTGRTLVSLSTPIIKQITFLNTPTERYGAFGYCSTSASSTPGLPGLGGGEGCVRATGYSIGPEIVEWMTRTAALFPLGQCHSQPSYIYP